MGQHCVLTARLSEETGNQVLEVYASKERAGEVSNARKINESAGMG